MTRPGPRLHLRLLGGFEARVGNAEDAAILPRKGQALLAYLALPLGRSHPRDKLATLLWGDREDEQARNSLRQVVFGLRRALGTAQTCLVAKGDTLALDPHGVAVDVASFEGLAVAATPAAWREAGNLYGGDLLEGLRVTEPGLDAWMSAERERIHERAIEVLWRLLGHEMKRESPETALATALRLLALNPFQESVHRAAMRLYVRLGRRAAALRQYQSCVETLGRDLGVDPDPETRELYQQILRAGADPPATPESIPAPGTPPASAASAARFRVTGPILVDREAELAQLHAALEGAWQGQGRVVIVRGEAGIGKSRLVAELAAHAEARGGGVHVAQAYEGEQNLPFGPWVGLLRAALADLGSASLSSLPPSWRTELRRLLPELADADPPPLEQPTHYRRLFEAVAGLIRHLARERRLLLVLENLHWADEPSLKLLAFLGRRLAGDHVLLVTTVRDDSLVDGRPDSALDELAGAESLTVQLGPLSHQGTVSLVRTLGGLGVEAATLDELAERVWAMSEGHPLLIHEMTPLLREGPGATGSPELSVPERIRALFAGRLRNLSDPGRTILSVLAIVAVEAEFGLILRATRLDEHTASGAIEELVRRRLLRSGGEGLQLSHEYLREVVLGQLIEPQRRHLHGRVGEALAETSGDGAEAPWARLAVHFREARAWARCHAALIRLGEQAARRYADVEATKALGEALDLVPRLPPDQQDRATVEGLVRLAPSLYRLGRFEETVVRLAPQASRVERLGDGPLSADFAFWLGNAHLHLAAPDAEAWGRRALAEAEQLADPTWLGRAHHLMTLVSYDRDRFAEGIDRAEQAVAVLHRSPERWWLGQTYFVLAGLRLFTGRFDQAIEAAAQARAIGEAIGDSRLRAYGESIAGVALATQGDGEAGVQACRRGLSLATDPLSEAGCRNFLGWALLEADQPAEARSFLTEAAERLGAMGVRRVRCRSLVLLGEASRLLGEAGAAGAPAREARAIATATASRYGGAWADRLLGRLAASAGDLPAARRQLGTALQGFQDTQAVFECGRTGLDLGELARATGDAVTARGHVARALEAFESIAAPHWAARARALG